MAATSRACAVIRSGTPRTQTQIMPEAAHPCQPLRWSSTRLARGLFPEIEGTGIADGTIGCDLSNAVFAFPAPDARLGNLAFTTDRIQVVLGQSGHLSALGTQTPLENTRITGRTISVALVHPFDCGRASAALITDFSLAHGVETRIFRCNRTQAFITASLDLGFGVPVEGLRFLLDVAGS